MIANRLYVALILANWLAAMGWLVAYRVLPPFYGGDGPATRPSNQLEPVAWRLEMGGKPCGEAVLQAVAGDGGSREVHSLLRLDRLEVPKGAPSWITPVLRSLRSVSFTMRTTTVYDGVDRLSSFVSRLQMSQSDVPVEVRGRVLDDTIRVTIRVGENTKRFDHPWPDDATLSNELTPTGRLLPIYEGRRWTTEVFSPFGPPNQAAQLIEAEVTEPLRLTQGGETVDAWKVEYRVAERTGSTEEGRLRAVLYVAQDGRIMKQEAFFLGSSITFIRENDEQSLAQAKLLELEKYATVVDNLPPDAAMPESLAPHGPAGSAEPRPAPAGSAP